MSGNPALQETARALLEVVKPRVSAEAVAWLARAVPGPAAPFVRSTFLGAYAGAARRLGGGSGTLSQDEHARLRAAGIVVPEVWSLAELARAALLLGAVSCLPAAEHVALATEIFRRGDTPERVALLRALPLLPGPERFAELGAEACRSHVLDVFAAIACDNPFPARCFPVLHFNQLVMKAMFVELPLSRVLGLRDRVGTELVRMASDYEAERRAAGRSVPRDIALLRAMSEAP
jgi:hypothetical protein